ncbi:MAG: InlB B-repeat-containing protein, partial [Rickettsiales bacterium]|nr:InlB B-repeat-containing protein [Rickettsiales bacterium]
GLPDDAEWTNPGINCNWSLTCAAGTYWDADANACTACPAGAICDGGSISIDQDTDITSDIGITGYTITFNKNGGTFATTEPNMYYINALPLTISNTITRTGYSFVGWCDNAELTSNCAITKTIPVGSTNAKTYYAKWTQCTGSGVVSWDDQCVPQSCDDGYILNTYQGNTSCVKCPDSTLVIDGVCKMPAGYKICGTNGCVMVNNDIPYRE